MAYPSKFRQLEIERGKSIAEILVEELNKHDANIFQTARTLNMSYDSVYAKVQELKLIKDPAQWRLPEAENA